MTVRLIPPRLSHDAIETFSKAAEDSKKGRLIGSIQGFMYSDLTIEIGSTGELYDNPLFARSVIAEMSDYAGARTKIVVPS